MLDHILRFDTDLLLFIQEYIRNPILTPVFRFITALGDRAMIWIIFSVVLLMFRKTRKTGVMALFALIFSALIVNLTLKNLVARPRPFEVIDGLWVLIKKPKGYSFPSGHTSSAFSAAAVYYKCLDKKYGIPAILLACLIGFSRLYLGVHYPSDVIAGAIIGLTIASAITSIVKLKQLPCERQ